MGRLGFREAIWADPQKQRICGADTNKIRAFRDLICRRLDWLEGRDRLFMELVYKQNVSYRQIAVLTGCSESTVSRRVRKLTRRLLSSKYQSCIRNRCFLSGFQLTLARQRFVLGLSRKEIARRHRVSLYSVDHHLQLLVRTLRSRRKEQIRRPSGFLKEGA